MRKKIVVAIVGLAVATGLLFSSSIADAAGCADPGNCGYSVTGCCTPNPFGTVPGACSKDNGSGTPGGSECGVVWLKVRALCTVPYGSCGGATFMPIC